MKRIKGYVVAHDKIGQEFWWQVKAKDSESRYDGKKFPVESFHPGTMIRRSGLDVTFIVKPIGPGKTLMAVDVAEGHGVVDECNAGLALPNSINFMLVKESAYEYATFTDRDEEEARTVLEAASPSAKLAAFLEIDPEVLINLKHLDFDSDTMAAFAELREFMFGS